MISGVVTGSLGEDGASLTASGNLANLGATAAQAGFVAQSGVAGAYGSFSLSAAGVWVYTLANASARVQALNEGQSVTEQFTVRTAGGVSSTISISIAGSNDAPVATAVVSSAAEDSAGLSGRVSAGDVDAGAVLTFSLGVAGRAARMAAPDGLTFNADGSFTFDATVPAYQALGAGQTQVLNVPYTVTDQFGASSNATLTITVMGTNDAPQASAASFSISEDDPVLHGNLIASDVDSGSALMFSLAGTAPPGLSLNSDGSFSFNAADPAFQSLADGDSLALNIPYIVTDEHGASASASLSITLTGVNDAAVISGVAVGALSEDGPSTTSSGMLTIADADAGQASFIAQTEVQGTYGSFSLSSDGAWTYSLNNGAAQVQALNQGESVTESFAVASADGSSTRSVVITISGSNDAPVARADFYATAEDSPLTISAASLIQNDDGLGLSVSSVQDAVGGSVALDSAGNVVFTPTANYSGPASFDYTVKGGGGASSATVNVDIGAVADAARLVSPSAVYSIRSGSTNTSTLPATTQANLEATLGLSPNQLDTFAPPAGIAPIATNDPGTVDVTGGNLTSHTLNLAAGSSANFGWQFFNGETSAGFINFGINDMVMLVVTDPNGTQQAVQLSSSEQTGPNTNGLAVDAAGTYRYTASTSGEYRFAWLVVNGGNGGGASSLTVTAPTISVGGVDYGMPVKLAIGADFADQDGSESVSISISGVPAGAALSAGTDLGGGVWSVTPAQLAGLQFLPNPSFNGTLSLTISATSVEQATGSSATTSQVVSVTIESTGAAAMGTNGADNLTGSAVNDHLQGFGGSDILSGHDGNDLLHGAAGTDTLNGGNGNDALHGGTESDVLDAGSGDDRLEGGAGGDSMSGGAGSDVFAWTFADRGVAGSPSIDVIADFDIAPPALGGDWLDLRDLLQGEAKAGFDAGTLDRFLDFDTSSAAGSTIIRISSSGAFSGGAYDAAAEDQRIVLTGIDLRSSAFGLDASASDNDVIHQLLQRGALIADGP